MHQSNKESEMAVGQRLERNHARRRELEPLLAQLATKARATYDLLRPRAKHVGDVERDYPLRHQQVHGMDAIGLGGVAADYLMIAFGNHHDLTLYHNFTEGRSFRWQFKRSLSVGNLQSECTKVEQLAQARSNAHGGGLMEIKVSTYRYPEVVGMGGQYVDSSCSYFNDFAEAERYVQAFEADLEEAVTRLS